VDPGFGPPPHPPQGEGHPDLGPLPPLIIGSLASLLFAIILARYFSRPIRSLGLAFEAIAEGKLETRIGHTMTTRRDELADLGNGFDSMAEQLERLVDGKQRLLHDVSHELRSPLARMQAAIDLMQQQPDRIGEFIARIERESVRIDKLVSELLTLARLDAGIPGDHMMEIDLAEMVAAITEDASFEAEIKSCRVTTSMPQKLSMYGNPDLVHRAIENIVRNAIRHSPEAGVVSIEGKVDEQQTSVTLTISDEGEGVPAEDLKTIFEPFYRSPKADRFKGFGIGMSMTRRVLDAHKGKVSAENKIEGGLVVKMAFPLNYRQSR
jgi:signal transduction histidine kinase